MSKNNEYEFECSAQLDGQVYVVSLTGHIRRDNDNAAAVVAALLDKKPKAAKLKVRLHDFYGGDIPEGLKIHADLVARGVEMEVDGVVASMGTVIMCAGKHVTATQRMRGMMHRASGKVRGNADELVEVAAELRGLEQQLVTILAERTGLNDVDARAKFMAEGTDSWYSAAELKRMGLVHRIVPTTVRAVPDEELPSLKSPAAMLARFAACLDDDKKPETGKTKAMSMKKELNAALGLDESAEESVAVSKAAAIVKENSELKAAAKARDEADAKRELEAAYAGIDAGVANGQLTKAQADTLKEDAKAAPALVAKTVATMIAGMPAHRSLSAQLTGSEGARGSKSLEAVYDKRQGEGWDMLRWSKEDPEGLAKLRDEQKELYADLRKTLKRN